ncbi:MAG: hypothetical protein ACKVS5_01240 [Parvularculaceae bacterium]
MDTAAYIVTLLVILAVGFWYLENEMKQSDGAHGLFAVRQAEASRKKRADNKAPRFRPRGADAAGKDAEPAPDSGSISGTAKYRRKERAWDRAAKLDDQGLD